MNQRMHGMGLLAGTLALAAASIAVPAVAEPRDRRRGTTTPPAGAGRRERAASTSLSKLLRQAKRRV
jgi:hypothetical protein